MKETFYTPSAEGGDTIGSTCDGNAGIPNTIVFQHPEARIDISIIERLSVMEVHFLMPEGVSLSVPATQFRVTTKKETELLLLKELKQYQFPPGPLGSIKIKDLPIKEQLMLQGGKLKYFFLTFSINVDQLNEFVLIFPVLLANEKKVSIPPITWTLTTEWIIWPINC